MFQFWLAHNHTMVVDIFKPFVPISPRFLPSKLFTLGSSHELTYLIDAQDVDDHLLKWILSNSLGGFKPLPSR